MSERDVAAGAVWVSLTVVSGALLWVIIGGLSASVVAFAITRQWNSGLYAGVVVSGIISFFGIVSMFSPGWYEGLL